MTWLVTGAAGMLGQDVVARLRDAGEDVRPLTHADLDITDGASVAGVVSRGDVVVNCAGWTDVDAAETHEREAFQANAVGPAVLARACREAAAVLVQVSTDYVVDGGAHEPIAVDAPLAPVSAYGRSKAAGEWAVRAEHPEGVLVLRTAWLYGAGGSCFPRTIARVARERGAVSVVDDQVGQPTWTQDVADLALRLVRAGVRTGTHHATASGRCSWFEFAQEVCAAAGLGADVVQPLRSAQLDRPAPRPAYSVLDHASLARVGVDPIGEWRQRWAAAAEEVLTLDRR